VSPRSPKASQVRQGSSDLSRLPVKVGHVDILNRAKLVFFDYPDWDAFRVPPQLQGEYQGIRRSDGSWLAPPSGTVAPLKCLTFAASLTLDMANLDSNPIKASSQSYASPLRPTASWAMVLSLSKSRSSTPMGNSLAWAQSPVIV